MHDTATALISEAATPKARRGRILALLPFLIKGALSLNVLRAMRGSGLDVMIADYGLDVAGYTPDAAEDFAADHNLLDMKGWSGARGVRKLEHAIRDRGITLLMQVGAPQAYAQVPFLKERIPWLRTLDILYNEVGHTLNHFLYENCFDGVIVESQAMFNFMLANSAKPAPSVRLVESGVDLARFAPKPPPPRPPGGLVVGYVGRMSPEKNPLGFADLAEALHPRLPGLSFMMFGEGGMAEEVRARISASPAAGAIRYEGFVDHPSTALAQLDVLVVPSRLDGRPNVVMEANACGVPVLGAPVGGIPEMIEPGRNGFVVAPGERDRIAAVLAGWAADPAALARVRAECRAVAESRFDRRRMLDAYEAVFREFLGEASPRP